MGLGGKMELEGTLAAILARIDRSSPDKLLVSLAGELERLHQANQAVLAKIAALETFQSISDQVLELGSNAPTESAESVTVDAAFSLSAENGFYGIECDAKGTPYRWTGPEPAFYFDLLIDRSSTAALTLRFLKIFGHPSPENRLRCFVDGQSVAVQTREVDGEFELNAELPRRSATGGSVIMFLCPSSRSPLTEGTSQDKRCLGLAFRWLKVDRAAEGKHTEGGAKSLDATHWQNEEVAKLELVQTISAPKHVSHGDGAGRKNRA
jgi:hypothetical protein